ncbi:uncharacterized protein SAPINGB_P000277 [Magnusiomyces paraingens]|uniref:Uncharacterized protein n=1 Tax=Magnusiomyces paraingens TaxID=2606893 RepID=A0A5E8B587_9ASCO|nr:uncharacterized protein SAPINGB_P000277 [Saprochaete ingens]VVT44050.1 unnamed protein product [Saprochaete ingens]
MPCTKKIPKISRENIKKRIEQGESFSKIMIATGVSKATISRIKKTMPNSPANNKPGRKRVVSPATESAMVNKILSGKIQTTKDLAMATKLENGKNPSPTTTRRILKRHNITMTPGSGLVVKPDTYELDSSATEYSGNDDEESSECSSSTSVEDVKIDSPLLKGINVELKMV